MDSTRVSSLAPLLEAGRRSESANVDPSARALVEEMIHEAHEQMLADPVSAAQECAVPVIGEVGPESPDDRTGEGSEAERTLTNNQITVLVRVVGVVPGWYLLYGHAASLVYARVVEVFHDNAGLLEPGQTITFLRESASFRIGQRRFCTRDPQTVPSPIGSLTKPGSRVAFLALDKDGDGVISSGAELFGASSVLEDGTTAANGFEALAAYDSNWDGVIDETDAVWPYLLLWTDTNHNGRADAGELTSAESAAIVAISLDYGSFNRVDQYGNEFRYRSEFRLRMPNGSLQDRAMYDVFFVTAPR